MAMSAIENMRGDLTAAELRVAAGRERNARASRRMLALALVPDAAGDLVERGRKTSACRITKEADA
jgi:hypothetical protein